MNVSDAIRQRRSIRDFLPRAVDEQTLREVLDVARWAPSGGNIQAWRMIAVAGAERDAIVKLGREHLAQQQTVGLAAGAEDPYPIYPREIWEPLRTRRYTLAEDMYRALGRVSGMDVDKIEREAQAENAAEQRARQEEQARLIGTAPAAESRKVAPE